jgi:5-methyltetrahydropteroyltriglutamate--homocysteine methyltransferase
MAGMKKWITSNYHYLVPEYEGQALQPNLLEYFANVRRGIALLGVDKAVPVVVGPVTLAYLTKIQSFASGCEDELRRDLLDKILPVYHNLLKELAGFGVKEIQIHEAALVFTDAPVLPLFQRAYPAILPSGPAINMVSFMEDIGSKHYEWLISLKEISIVSLDFTRGNTMEIIEKFGFPQDKVLGAGLIDARNVWRMDPKVISPLLNRLKAHVAQIRVQPSASLQFNPWSLQDETALLEHPAGTVLSFAKEKLDEIELLKRSVDDPSCLSQLAAAWDGYRAVILSDSTTRARVGALTDKDYERSEPFGTRRAKQLVGVPILPTTTIGSFPQTKAIRGVRAQYKKGVITKAQYEAAIDNQIAYAMGVQECLGLDILVHGEAERTDMVEFFGEQMNGILITTNGWVQSFGSRCVRPPIFWSDISRPHPMTVREFKVAQNLTEKPVKGMLTGPVTILNWSFPRTDISRKEQAIQLALCVSDEVADLERAGCRVIQVDEPALREAMPLRPEQKIEYLTWAVDAFRLSTAVAAPETQIHTHMCYCEFGDCMEAIDRLDVDVNSIENARSDDATLLAFQRIGYSKDLGPGTYDIHSPVVPEVSFIYDKLKTFLRCIPVERLVVNPDCGLKTRSWPETNAALKNMVEATMVVRKELMQAQS